MYVEHYTSTFYNKRTGLFVGWLGAELQQLGDGKLFNEARYYDPKSTTTSPNRPHTMKLMPRGFKSDVYIKAVAISCNGCQTVRNYASFTCQRT